MYRKILFLLLCLFVLSMYPLYGHNIGKSFYLHRDTSSTGQACDTSSFRITYKGEAGSWILDTKSLPGNQAISAGQNNTDGNNNGWLLKVDQFGNILWSIEYGSDLNDYFKKVLPTTDNGFLAIGSIQNSGSTPTRINGYAWAIKTDAQGNIQWSYKLNISPSDMQQVIQTKDGGYAIVASINVTGSSSSIAIIKINANGTLQWMKEYSNGSTAWGYYIKQSPDGNLIVAGFVYGWGAGLHDGFVMKISGNDGTVLWLKTYGSPSDDVIDCFDQDDQGNLYLSLLWGVTNQASILKTDSNGNILWAKLYTTSLPSSRGTAIKLTSSHNIILSLLNANRFFGGAVMQVSDSGTFEWAYDYHPSGSDIYSQYALDELSSHNGFLIGGTANIGSPNDFEGYLAKTDANGKAGSCEINPIKVTVSNISPLVKDNQWTSITSATEWVPIQVFTKTDTIAQHHICPQCCISSNTTIDTAICQGETYKLPDDSVVNQAGTYAVKLASSIGCDSIITTDLSFKGPVNIQYPDSICEGTSLTLPDGTRVTEPGDYTVDLPSATGCDTLAVYHVFMKYPPVVHLNGDTCLITGQRLSLNAGDGYQRYEWQDGSTDSTMVVTNPGTYWVNVSNSCGSVTDSVKVTNDCLPDIYIPSAFTPDGDGMNDVFRILNVHGQKLILFDIYNRWGKMVFHTVNINRGWDGRFKGNPQPTGAYIYLIKIINLAGQEKVYKGSVVLIR